MIKIMKITALLFFTFQMLSCASQSTVIEGHLETVVTKPMDYYLYYPENYEVQTTKTYGILLFLHGSGSIPKKGQEKMPPPDALIDGTEYPFLILVPQLQEPKKMWNTEAVMQLLDTVVAKNRIDEKNISNRAESWWSCGLGLSYSIS
ncbi:hypothetical protein M601_006420 [Cellulophaga baltica 4]|nr:hypothetical protein M601_006420 [Cellulophaga baltica 4]